MNNTQLPSIHRNYVYSAEFKKKEKIKTNEGKNKEFKQYPLSTELPCHSSRAMTQQNAELNVLYIKPSCVFAL